jgi:hypothetical protein
VCQFYVEPCVIFFTGLCVSACFVFGHAYELCGNVWFSASVCIEYVYVPMMIPLVLIVYIFKDLCIMSVQFECIELFGIFIFIFFIFVATENNEVVGEIMLFCGLFVPLFCLCH